MARDQRNNGSDTNHHYQKGTATQQHGATPTTSQPAANAGVLEHGYVGPVDHQPTNNPKSAIRN